MKHTLSLALAGLFCASAVQAFEVTGGSLSLGYSSFIGSSPATDVNKLSLGSSMEFGLSQQFSVQGDFALTKFNATNLDNTNFGLHAIFHVNESTSVGAFIGRDRIEHENLNYFGVEVGHQAGAFGTEAFLTIAKDGGSNGTVIGVKGEYSLTDSAMLGARFDLLNVDGADAAKFAIIGEVAALPGLNLTGELGQARIDGIGSEAYVGVGVKVNFGAKRGATFDRRSIIDLLPGG
ncbi:MAG: hypothetical protein U0934_12820 [Pseudotabrizicola sp.]|uniref:hypothetical protein n=1 Tax=Pseudotabrizicola sp. TaxID=2939647 RepID=UPI0027166786|nr:hypothetical protein [Pseudotabrizicola sp.]MDO8882552.1 hypothetical protein [Pseudotabrizicola sp.]MDP2079820.1 hypothetical protein [Pseudotabrizicola sp.]MDZ7574821.1 hypothetical protein [Pseudotabrizicola sp.]